MANKQILVIEDSQTQANRIRMELERHGLQVTLALTGSDGLDLAHSLLPDAIILDIELPDPNLTGYDVCRILKCDTATAHIPVVMLTHYDNAPHALEGLQLGAIDYIPKDTFAEHNLIESLRQLAVL